MRTCHVIIEQNNAMDHSSDFLDGNKALLLVIKNSKGTGSFLSYASIEKQIIIGGKFYNRDLINFLLVLKNRDQWVWILNLTETRRIRYQECPSWVGIPIFRCIFNSWRVCWIAFIEFIALFVSYWYSVCFDSIDWCPDSLPFKKNWL